AHPGAVIEGGEHVAARLGPIGEDGERPWARGTLGHEVGLHEDLERVLELEHVPEEAARGAGRLPGWEPVALRNAGALEDLGVHLEMPLLVRELEQTAP